MQLCNKCMDHGNKCIIFPHNAKQNEMTILIGCKSYTTGATNTSGPGTASLPGHPISCCSISSFLHSALLFIVCPLVLFSFRHCIVCQTMTFFLLDIALSVKVWLFSFRHFIVGQTTTFFSFRHCIVCQTMTFFPLRHCIVCQAMTFVLLDIVLSVKLWLFSFRHFIVCQTMTFFLLDIVLSVKLWLFFFWTLYCLSSYDFIFS